jgi:hypothetical protein
MFKATITARLVGIALSLLAQIPWDKIVEIIRTQFERKVQPAILREIDRLVDLADDMDLPGEEKFSWVFESLRSPTSPVKTQALSTATYLLDTAIQVAVTRIRSIQA